MDDQGGNPKLMTTRGIRFGAVVVAVCLFGAGCGDSESSDSGEPSTDSAANSSVPQQIPASPVTANDKSSADEWAQTLEQNPCPDNLRQAVLGILQSQREKVRPGSDPSAITVGAAKSDSVTGIPQCTFTVTGFDSVSTITFASVTAAANRTPAGTLQLSDVILADPTASSTGVLVEPACQITQEFLGRLARTNLTARSVTTPGYLDDTIQITGSYPIKRAAWKYHTLIAKRACADTFSTGATPGDSPDWILQLDAAGNGNVEPTHMEQGLVADYLANWVSGLPVGL